VTVALFLLAFSLATAQDAEQQGVRLLVSITFEDHEEADGSAAGTFLLDLRDCWSPELTWTATAVTPTSTSTAAP